MLVGRIRSKECGDEIHYSRYLSVKTGDKAAFYAADRRSLTSRAGSAPRRGRGRTTLQHPGPPRRARAGRRWASVEQAAGTPRVAAATSSSRHILPASRRRRRRRPLPLPSRAWRLQEWRHGGWMMEPMHCSCRATGARRRRNQIHQTLCIPFLKCSSDFFPFQTFQNFNFDLLKISKVSSVFSLSLAFQIFNFYLLKIERLWSKFEIGFVIESMWCLLGENLIKQVAQWWRKLTIPSAWNF